jgi:hypothetical protein
MKIVKLFYLKQRLIDSINLIVHPYKEGNNEKSNDFCFGSIVFDGDFQPGFGSRHFGLIAGQADEAQPQEAPH